MYPIWFGCSDCKWTPHPVQDATPSSKKDSMEICFTEVGSEIRDSRSVRRGAVGTSCVIFFELTRGFRGVNFSRGAASAYVTVI
jgi:hypothetical protein